ncbi:MAG: hypothetical protein EOO52_13120 [Gammaproteobacteria bacterium]|nr:MAG: hypothetical protein EOO52_13120 [Gammaproteobacteria bacterium]
MDKTDIYLVLFMSAIFIVASIIGADNNAKRAFGVLTGIFIFAAAIVKLRHMTARARNTSMDGVIFQRKKSSID